MWVIMGELGDAFSFETYISALDSQRRLNAEAVGLAETLLVGGLGMAAMILFTMMVFRRSGVAAAGFALTALTALGQGMMFGRVDFLTEGTTMLIAALTVSALLLFVNAVLHTGRENMLLASLSAVVIGLILTLGGLTAAGLDYGGHARTAIFGATLLSAAILLFALIRDPKGRGAVSFFSLLALFGIALMLDQVAGSLAGFAAVIIPAALSSFGILIAASLAPFLDRAGEPATKPARAREPALSPAFATGSLFSDSDREWENAPRRAEPRREEPAHRFEPAPTTERAAFTPAEPEPLSEPAGDPQPEPDFSQPEPAPDLPRYAEHRDPVSSNWNSKVTGAPLEAAPSEYIWDALADPEVRAGTKVLNLLGVREPRSIDLEGLRERLDPAVLVAFDEGVLGGGDPMSGPFDVSLATAQSSFRFRGRRQVDTDGILMRIEGEVLGLRATQPAPAPTAAPSSAMNVPASSPEPRQPKPMARRQNFPPVVSLGNSEPVGFDATPTRPVSGDEAAKQLIDSAGAHLAGLLSQAPRSGAFALIDAARLGVRFGTIAGAVGKAVRVHELPRGALVVGLDVAAAKDPKLLVTAAEDIRRAGGSVALIVPAEGLKKSRITPDMIWIRRSDAQLARGKRKGPIAQLVKKHDVPVVVIGIGAPNEADDAIDQGARFATGSIFADAALPKAEPAMPSFSADTKSPEDRSASIRARGLR